MVRVAAGDHAAFATLVRRHEGAVFGTAARMLGDPTEAEDITQQAFLRILKAAPGYRPEAKFTTWMFTIVRNLVFNESRRRGRHTHASLEAPAMYADTSTPVQFEDVHATPPDADVLQRELESEIQNALAALPPQQRMAMILLRYEDMAYDEIGRVLNLSVPAVKSQIFRARETLRERLRRYLGATNPDSQG